MKVSVFGLGYVGTVVAGCLAMRGHQVIAVDVNATKVDLINGGTSPVPEPGLEEIVRQAVTAGTLRATTDPGEAVAGSAVSLLCVGTPSQANGDVRLDDLVHVCGEIGDQLSATAAFHLVVVCSTVPPGTTRDVVIPTISARSGRRHGEDFAVCMSPEFLREGSAVNDYLYPARTVVGASEPRFGELAAQIWASTEAPVFLTDFETAEMVKLTDNAWHALKISFANEIGRLAQAWGVDSQKVMEIFKADTKLNISPLYLRPGFAFGGSCLPKDLRTLTYRAEAAGIAVPVLASILPSNSLQIEAALAQVLATGRWRVGLLGLSFKPGTDDLRESPLVTLAQQLLFQGYELRIYDPNIHPEQLLGANRAYAQSMLPNLTTLLASSLEEVLTQAQVIVIGNDEPVFRDLAACLRPDQTLLDLTRMASRPDARVLPAAQVQTEALVHVSCQ